MQSRWSPIVQEIQDELAKLRQLPRNQARTVSAAYYTAPEFLELEKQELFRKEWICLGHEGEIPRAGDYFTTDLVDESLLVVRGQDNNVRVLSNVCRHRGNVVARGSGNSSRFTCGYHAWTYGTDGQLIGAPLMEGFDKSSCRLPSFTVQRWKGFIFVNLEGGAQPLKPALWNLEPYIQNYHLEQQHHLYGTEEIWATNWKCLVENFMEGYHLTFTHPKTLWMTPTALCERLPDGPAFTGYRSGLDPSYRHNWPYQPDLTEVERRSGVFYRIYPSFAIGIFPGFSMYLCVRPLAVDSLGVRWGLVGIGDDPGSARVNESIQGTNTFNAEDRATLEGLHKGLKTRYYNYGPLAGDNFEGTIWDILQYMARRLGSSHPVVTRSVDA
jgi:choline monooxygenase